MNNITFREFLLSLLCSTLLLVSVRANTTPVVTTDDCKEMLDECAMLMLSATIQQGDSIGICLADKPDSTFQLTVAIIGQVGGVTYQWFGVNFDTPDTTGIEPLSTSSSPTVTVVSDTAFVVAATDANGTLLDTIKISAGTEFPEADPDTSTVCEGGDHILTLLNPEGAQTGVTVTYHATLPEANAGMNPITTATGAGTVFARVSSGGCFATSEITLEVNPNPVASISSSAPILNDTTYVCDGSTLTLTASGGTTYSWSSGATTAAIDVSPSAVETYIVTVSDANGCASLDSIVAVPLMFDNPYAASPATLDTAAGCPVPLSIDTNMAIVLNPLFDYTAAFLNGLDNTMEFTVNEKGITDSAVLVTSYNLLGTNITVCTDTTYSEITTYDSIELVVADQTVCEGEPVTVSLAATGGFTNGGDYTYSIAGVDTVSAPGAVNVEFTADQATEFVIFVSDSTKNVERFTFTLNVIDSAVANITTDSTSLCVGDSIQINFDEVPGYDYTLTNVSANNFFVATSPGLEMVELTASDINSACPDSVIMVNFLVLDTSMMVTEDSTICAGSSIDLSTLVMDGLAPSLTFHTTSAAAMSGTGALASTTVMPLVTTTYFVRDTGMNAANCNKILPITITPVTPIGQFTETMTTLCFGDSLSIGDLTQDTVQAKFFENFDGVTATGEITNFSHATLSGLANVAPSMTVLGADSVVIYLADSLMIGATGCASYDSIIVILAPEVTAEAGSDTLGCEGEPVVLTGAGTGTGTLAFAWDQGTVSGSTTSIIVTPTDTAILTVTDSLGCTAMDTVAIDTVGTATVTGKDTTICSGDFATLNAITTGRGPFTFAWLSLSGDTLANNKPYITPALTETTQFIVVATNDDANCSMARDTVTVTVTNLVNTTTLPTTICTGDSVELAGVATGGTAPYTAFWNGFTDGDFVTVTSTITIELDSVVDANGCVVLGQQYTINAVDTIKTTDTLAFCGTTVFNGKTFEESGISVDTFASAAGCDSIVTTTIIITEDVVSNTVCRDRLINLQGSSSDLRDTCAFNDFICVDGTAFQLVDSALIVNGDSVIKLGEGGSNVLIFNANPTPGLTLGAGQYDIEKVYVYDNNGTLDTVSCEYVLSVICDDSIDLVCNDEILISLADDCSYALSPDDVLENPTACGASFDDYQIQIERGINVLGNNMITGADIGRTLRYRIRHLGSDNFCWGELKVEDKIAPTLTCRNDTLYCTNPVLAESDYLLDDVLRSASQNRAYKENGTAINLMIESTCDDGNDFRFFGEQITNVVVRVNNTKDTIVVSYTLDGLQYTTAPLTGRMSYSLEDIHLANVTYDENEVAGTFTVRSTSRIAANRSSDISIVYTHGIPLKSMIQFDDCSGEMEAQVISSSFKADGCNSGDLWLGGTIERVISVKDGQGREARCVQTIYILTPTFDRLNLPGDAEVDCDDIDIEVQGLTGVQTAAQITPAVLAEIVGADQSAPFFGCQAINPNANPNICKITYTYKDQVFQGCVGIKIVRNWEVINWCTRVVKTHRQVILIDDVDAPTIADDIEVIEVGTQIGVCESDFMLTNFYSDACSEITSMEVVYNVVDAKSGNVSTRRVNGLTNSITGLPLGVHTLRVKAADACGNETEGYDNITVRVVDDAAPVVIMDDSIRVTIGSNITKGQTDGRARVRTEDIDEGSFDNCGIAEMKVRRLDGCLGASRFADYVEFGCCDVGTAVRVELRVTDLNGNSAVSWGFVNVEGAQLSVSCPADVTVSCDKFNASLANSATSTEYGFPSTVDGCTPGVDSFWVEDKVECGEGTFTRYWSYDGGKAGVATCKQVITVTRADNKWKVTFPANDTVSCLEELPGDHSLVFADVSCTELLVKCDTLKLVDAEETCGEYQITYTVIDRCAYDSGNPDNNPSLTDPTGANLGNRMYRAGTDGIIRYTQRVFILDNTKPVFNCASGVDTFNSLEADCSATLRMSATATDQCADNLQYRTSIDVNGNGIYFESADITVNRNNIEADLPSGSYTVLFEATDGCGNRGRCIREAVIRDGKAPTPICYAGLTTALMPESGMVEIWAIDFLKDAVDNCTDREYLMNSVDGRVSLNGLNVAFSDTIRINCELVSQTGGVIPIDVRITDEAGNSAICRTTLLVRDNLNTCPQTGSSRVAVGGLIKDVKNEEVTNVSVSLNGATPVSTADRGAYAFGDLTQGSSYAVKPSKNDDYSNGVSISDLTKLYRHILGKESLSTAEQMIAGDIDRNGSLSIRDVSEIQRLILGRQDKFSDNTSWRFIDAGYTFNSVTNALSENFPEQIELKSLTSSSLTSDFKAIKVGDLDASAVANGAESIVDTRSGRVIDLTIGDQQLEAGKTYEVIVKAASFESVLGYEFGLSFDADAIELQDVRGLGLEVNENNFNLDAVAEGVVKTAYGSGNAIDKSAGSDLFSLTFKANVSGQLSDFLGMNDLVHNEGSVLSGNRLEKSSVAINFGGTQETNNFELFQNRPNPFTGETVIGFALPQASEAVMTVYDMSGKVLNRIEGDYSAGYNEIRVDGASIPSAGVLFYELSTSQFSAVKRMILVK